jgi:methylmalonyl-CoA mutase cobalamin-binding domain/chain
MPTFVQIESGEAQPALFNEVNWLESTSGRRFWQHPRDVDSRKKRGGNMAQVRGLYDAILHGDANKARIATEAAIAAGAAPMDLISESMVPAMDEAGRLFEAKKYFVPELHLSSRAMKSAMSILRPLLAATGQKMLTRVVIGSVVGEFYDIGKNLVASMLEGGGFEVIDLGTNVSPEAFVAAVKEQDARLVCMSALLTVTLPAMKATVDALKTAGVRTKVLVLIGGASVTMEYAKEIGADGYSENAIGAVSVARNLLTAA